LTRDRCPDRFRARRHPDKGEHWTVYDTLSFKDKQ
jgi:hypothetical protein